MATKSLLVKYKDTGICEETHRHAYRKMHVAYCIQGKIRKFSFLKKYSPLNYSLLKRTTN